MTAKTRGITVDFVLEMASLDVAKIEGWPDGDARASLAHLVRVAQGIAHDHYLDQIEPWDEDPPADSEGGDSD